MEKYANQSRWPFFDQKTPRPIIAVRRELATGDRTLPAVVDSTIRILEHPPSQIAISYLPGTRPDNGNWKKVSYHAKPGDSFCDERYSDLGIIFTNPLEIYENDSEEVKEAIQKFFTLASKIQSAQEMLEAGWKEFLGVEHRNDLVRWAEAPPAIEATPPIEPNPPTKDGEQTQTNSEVKGRNEGDVKGDGNDKEHE